MKGKERHLRAQLADIQRLLANGAPERVLRGRLEALLESELTDLETRLAMLLQIVQVLEKLHAGTTSAPAGNGRSAHHMAVIAAFRHLRHPDRPENAEN